MSDNLQIWTKVREVPKSAVKPITGGRLKGMSDINPVWRLKTLTEQFGPCGFGWKYEIVEKRLEHGYGDEIAAFVDIVLYVKVVDESDPGHFSWSEPIPGTGGSMFVAKEKSGFHTSDECFKMALTDAISVACKALGFGADVYWDKDKTKYDDPRQDKDDIGPETKAKPETKPVLSPDKVQRLEALRKQKGITEEQHQQALKFYKVSSVEYLSEKNYQHYIRHLEAQPNIPQEAIV